ncbi:hypothetical protein [Dyadobacter aurulentus]|uniref:hypothetical protein n=1 Tax=Dyadobacter sp. UC 10 TaxID=2605428 RepID=UPI00125C3186|nr:hypothetical protein [Dyadobacter sp. UC 10]KAA0992752.1 hypothetical protein FXO21_22535 [Dyadobacter sp. UC 10]
MANVKELKADLDSMRFRWRLLPAADEAEKLRRQCEENILLIQLECEGFRSAFRREFLMTKSEQTFREIDGVKVADGFATVFNWEPVRDRITSLIDKKEVERINFYKQQILDSYTNATTPQIEEAAV